MAQRYEYAPFGEPLATEGSQPSLLRYTGEQWDANVSLLYLRARWLDVATGRFTQWDLWEGRLQQPLSLHPYVYAGNDPANRTDPTGQFWYDPINDRWIWNGIYYLEAPVRPKIEFYADTNPFMEREEVIAWIMPGARQIEGYASQHGVPPELVAGLLAAELEDDMAEFDVLTDASALLCYELIEMWQSRLFPLIVPCMCRAYLSGYSSVGVGVGPAQIHVNREGYDWWAVVQHYRERGYQLPGWVDDPVHTLLTTSGAAEGVAIFSRALADVRTGINAPHASDLGLDDMAIIFVGYRYGVGGFTDVLDKSYVFPTIPDFQSAVRSDLKETPVNARRDFDLSSPYFDAFQFFFEHLDLYEAEYGQ